MEQPKLKDFTEKTGLSRKEYNEFYVGKFKDHKRKLRKLFHNNKITKQKDNQVDYSLAKLITT